MYVVSAFRRTLKSPAKNTMPESSRLQIAERQVGDVTVLGLTGEMLLDDGDLAFRRKIHELVESGRVRIVVDLGGVTYIDSSGIASFVEGYQRARKIKLQFGLVAASPAVLSVLKLARLDRVFPLHADLTSAYGAGA